MELPKTIQIGATKYHVFQLKKGSFRFSGDVSYKYGLIRIHMLNGMKQPRKPERIRNTFWHEVTHAVLHDMDNPLYNDEAFVTAFADRLSSAIDSARFE